MTALMVSWPFTLAAVMGRPPETICKPGSLVSSHENFIYKSELLAPELSSAGSVLDDY